MTTPTSSQRATAPLLALTLLAGCGDSEARPGATATGITGATSLTTAPLTGAASTDDVTPTDGSASASAATTGDAATSEDSAAATTGAGGLPKLDVQGSPTPDETTGGATSAGCDKVDFLFVVDNSGSMADEQSNLIASFPGFIATITDTLGAKDYHIMAVSTDDGTNTGHSSKCTNGDCSCTPAPVCCENACASGGQTCNGFDCNNLPISQCNFEYGTGKEFDANGTSCDLEGGRRYMLDSQPNLDQTFECIANVGTYGSGDEKPMQAAIAACSEAQNGPGGCDEGFLRDDAILVLTIITDEEDDGDGSPGDPQAWYDAVVAAKHGDPKAVVVLGLVGDGNLPNGTCGPDLAEPAPRLQSFVNMFPGGVLGSVCAADYTPFFLEAVSVIDVACEVFEPPG